MFLSLVKLEKQTVINDQSRYKRSVYTPSLIMIVFLSCLPRKILIFNVFYAMANHF